MSTENARSDHVPRAARTCGQCAQRCSKGKRDRHSERDCFSQTRALSRQRLAALGLTVEHGRRLIRRANGGWSVPESTQTAGNRTGRWPGNGMHRGRTRIQAKPRSRVQDRQDGGSAAGGWPQPPGERRTSLGRQSSAWARGETPMGKGLEGEDNVGRTHTINRRRYFRLKHNKHHDLPFSDVQKNLGFPPEANTASVPRKF